MMGFGGSVAAMIQSLNNNKRSRTSLFEKEVAKPQKLYGYFQDHKKMFPKAFALFKERLQLAEQHRQRKFYILFSIIMVVFLSVGVYFLFFF